MTEYRVILLAGFATMDAAPEAEAMPDIDPLPDGETAPGALYAVEGDLVIQPGEGGRYLQCLVKPKGPAAFLELWSGEALIDRADLVSGWQNAAVDLTGLNACSQAILRVVDQQGQPAGGFEFSRIWQSAQWGRGQRRRLKCYFPFSYTTVFADQTIYPCCCLAWIRPNMLAGNAASDAMKDVWNGPVYQAMRQQFLAGDYATSCRPEVCPKLQSPPAKTHIPADDGLLSEDIIAAVNDGLTELSFGPAGMHHDIDYGCNLECTMCRDTKILPERAKIGAAVSTINEVVVMGSLEAVSFSGAGEVLIMRDMVKFIESDVLSAKNIGISLTTNATNFSEKMWSRIRHNRFDNVFMSIDGASSDVYDRVRVGSRWVDMQPRIAFLGELRQRGLIRHLQWNYTVQLANISDVGAAITMARELGFDTIRLIPHSGTLQRTQGNMFEDYDQAALDALHAQIEAVGGLDDPMVGHHELRMQDQQYRTLASHLDMAELLLDRIWQDPQQAARHGYPDWTKTVSLVERAASLAADGRIDDDAVTDRNRAFLDRLASVVDNVERIEKTSGSALRQVRARLFPDARHINIRKALRRLQAPAG